jgi:hypothetical protein
MTVSVHLSSQFDLINKSITSVQPYQADSMEHHHTEHQHTDSRFEQKPENNGRYTIRRSGCQTAHTESWMWAYTAVLRVADEIPQQPISGVKLFTGPDLVVLRLTYDG